MPKLRTKKSEPAEERKPVRKHAQLEARIGLMVSNGDDYRAESLEELIEKFREFARTTWPEHHNLTVVGSYYLIDGKVCRPEDFDRKTMDRKPGTLPPSWSLAGDEKEDARRSESAKLAERNKEQATRKNHLSHQPENLLTSKEMDELKKKEPSAKKVLRVPLKKSEPAPVKKMTLKKKVSR